MSAVGPTVIGGSQVNNATSVGFKPGSAVPAGAMIVLACATSAPDTSNFSASDTKGNNYDIQTQNQVVDQNGVLGPLPL